MTKRKILFANIPDDGHFNPLTGLAAHLKSIGHDVRWYAQQIYKERIIKLGIPHYPHRKALQVNQQNLDTVLSGRTTIKNQVRKLNYDMQHFFILRAPEFYEDILEISYSFDFDLLICNTSFTAIPFIKDKMKKPVLSVGVIPLTATSKDLPPYGLGMTPSTSFVGKKKQSFLRFLATEVLFRPSGKVMTKMFEEHGLYGKKSLFDQAIEDSTLVLQSGTPGFDYERSDMPKNVRFIGPLLPHSQQKRSGYKLSKNVKDFDKVVLVTQGTVERNPEKIIVPVLEAFRNTNTLVIATTGGSQTKDLQVRYPDNNFLIEDFIPFNDVMPLVDVYVTNGGYGGVLLGIQNRLPMVVGGVHEGKSEICARVGYFKLGVNLKTETPTADKIRSAVEQVAANKEYKSNVEKLAAEFAGYNPNQLVEKYVNEIFGEGQILIHKAQLPYVA